MKDDSEETTGNYRQDALFDRDKLLQEKARKKYETRKPKRVTFDLPPVLKNYIKQIAEEEKTTASQLATLALLRFYKDREDGLIELSVFKEPSKSPRYEWNLVFPDKMFPKE